MLFVREKLRTRAFIGKKLRQCQVKSGAYFFENICRADTSLALGDRAYKVFFNAANCDRLESGEMRGFFKFLSGARADTAFSKRIEERLEFAKRNMAWRKQYMTWQQTIDEEKLYAFEDGVREGHDAGVMEGVERNARESARNFLRMNLGTPEQIAQGTGLPLEEVLALKDGL